MKAIKSETLIVGLAVFSMFFGAGNIIYPLALGQHAGDKNLFAIFGLILTAAVMPAAGVLAMIFFDGDYRAFFGRLGKIPGFLLAIVIISLLGPLGSSPRCIALSYTTLKSSFPNISSTFFSAIACMLIFAFTVRKNRILDLLGQVLTPFLLASLILTIVIGLFTASDVPNVDHTNLSMFLHGLVEGYNTMDLLAAFFFSSTIINILRARFKDNSEKQHSYLNIALKANIIGAFLLTLVYIGFSYIASYHATDLLTNGKEELLAAITLKIAGPYAGILVCITVALACLTTAIALICAFTDFMQREVFNDKINYEITLTGALLLTFFVSTFEFHGISAFLWPVLQICYPGLIVLTFLNIAYKLTGVNIVKVPVFATFAISAILYFVQ